MARFWVVCLALLALAAPARAQESFPVEIQVNAARPGAELRPIWRFFGGDEPNYATMRDGRELLGELGALAPGEIFSAPTICSTLATARRR